MGGTSEYETSFFSARFVPSLPTMIRFAGGKTIKYTYSADGRKLRAAYTTVTPVTSKTVDYCGNLIFENGQLKQVLVDGGYIPMDDWSGTYRFYVKDHLGNNRMVVHQSGTIEQVNNYYPYGGLMANTTGWNAQRFKYNGKEFDRMHGLDWYDYGARWMDASIGRWHSIDPLCEKYYNVSPYVYCAGNPVRFIDPDGKEVRDGTGAYCEDNKDAKQLAKTLAAHNDPNSIMIVAHGIVENNDAQVASYINIQTYNTKSKEWEDNEIANGEDLNKFLSKNSETWNKYKNGKIDTKDLHIVFYSCSALQVVKKISSNKHFNDVTFIAADKDIQVLPNATNVFVGPIKNRSGKKYLDYRHAGQWHTVRNGGEPLINGNYSGKSNLRPGTKGFEYERTIW